MLNIICSIGFTDVWSYSGLKFHKMAEFNDHSTRSDEDPGGGISLSHGNWSAIEAKLDAILDPNDLVLLDFCTAKKVKWRRAWRETGGDRPEKKFIEEIRLLRDRWRGSKEKWCLENVKEEFEKFEGRYQKLYFVFVQFLIEKGVMYFGEVGNATSGLSTASLSSGQSTETLEGSSPINTAGVSAQPVQTGGGQI